MKKIRTIIGIIVLTTLFFSCSSGVKSTQSNADSTVQTTETPAAISDTNSATTATTVNSGDAPKAELSNLLIYSFHVTNRCASCIAIEESTKKTLDTYFKNEVKSGRIKLFSLNVDDKENEKIAEKYQAFGSGLFVTRVFKGKESTTDFTGEGFKYARNKQDKFIEILKNKIQEYLK